MSKVVVIGGKLQGVEALYLGKKAGFTMVLIDKNFNAPAKYLCDQFLCYDIFLEEEAMIKEFVQADFVLPAMENDAVLEKLVELAQKYKFVLAFDLNAYKISSSKARSNKLFCENGISMPMHYLACEPPYIAKPCYESGSVGVTYLESRDSVRFFLMNKNPSNWIIQEFIMGPSYSIEIIGRPGNYRTYEVTQIHMDDIYDCKMVSAPCVISESQLKGFCAMAIEIAELIGLHGIMDLEVIDHQGVLKLLEIDARIPSQTPIAVYHATGMNFMEELRDIFCYGTFKSTYKQRKKFVTFEHYFISEDHFEEKGEHIMSQGGPLEVRENFYGANEVLSDYKEGKIKWSGTFINWHENFDELQEKRRNMQKLLGEKI